MYMFIYRQSGEVRFDHKWSLETHVETHSNARIDLAYLELPLVIRSPKVYVIARWKQDLNFATAFETDLCTCKIVCLSLALLICSSICYETLIQSLVSSC